MAQRTNQKNGENMEYIDDLVFIIAASIVTIVCFMASPILGFIILTIGIVLYGITSDAFGG